MDEKMIRGRSVDVDVAGLTKTHLSARWNTACLLGCLVVGGALGSPVRTAAQEMGNDTEERVKRATVLVFTAASKSKKGDQKLGSGSGFFINGTGMLITNNHVVDPAHKKSMREKQEFHYKTGRLTWTVVTDSGTDEEKIWECDVVYQNDAADQAILQAYDEEHKKLQTPNYLRLLPESRLKERMKVWALGFPGGDSLRTSQDKKHPEVSLSTGYVIDLPRTPAGRVRMIWTDVLARPGNSGGPMVDVDGFCVGTATLMGQSEGRANTSTLVPAALSSQFIRNAFDLGRVPEGADVTPFVDILTNENGRLNIPEYDRFPDRDVLFYENGDRIYGTIATNSITWESPLGTLEVPTNAVAYVMSNNEGSNLFLEGGDHISASEVGSKFQFTPNGGTQIEQSFDETGLVVGFKASGQRLEPVAGKVIVFVSDVSHLVLSDVEGKAKFDCRAGTIDIALENIVRIDTRSDTDKQVVTLADGRRITGRFQDVPLRAKLAATKTPIQFELSEVLRAAIEVLERGTGGFGGLDLLGVLASADRAILQIASTLEAGDHRDARARIDRLLAPDEFRNLPGVTKEQVRLLDGVAALRVGDFNAASKSLRRSTKAQDKNIAAYAGACAAVLKRFGVDYNGRPLSDPTVFSEAGVVLGEELIQQVRELLKDRRALQGKKGEYARSVNVVKKHEALMQSAAVLAGTEADDQRIRLWKFATEVCQREIQRLNEELGETEQPKKRGGGSQARRARGGQRSTRIVNQRERDKLREEREEVRETLQQYEIKLATYGFRIEDPDIQDFHERQEDDEP